MAIVNPVIFGGDRWLGDFSLKEKVPELWSVCNEKSVSVALLARRNWRLTFVRWLDEFLQNQLNEVKNHLVAVVLNDNKDLVKWKFEKSGKFTI